MNSCNACRYESLSYSEAPCNRCDDNYNEYIGQCVDAEKIDEILKELKEIHQLLQRVIK